MDETFGPDFFTVEDEDGNEFELELIDSVEHNGIVYHAFFPASPEDEEMTDIDEDEEGLVILKVIEDNGEEVFSSLDSDEEAEEIFNVFMERFMEESEEED